MNFHPEKGIERLKNLLQMKYDQLPEDFYTLEMRLAKNRRDARLFGDDDPANRSELHRILSELNHFALEHIKVAFPDLYQDHVTSMYSSPNEHKLLPKSVSPSQPSSSSAGSPYLGTKRRWAVLVGVGDYEDREYSELPVCVYDVTEIAHQLYSNESGFTPASINVLVDDGIKPTRDTILSCLQKVAEAAEEDDLLLFYYSGHGELEQEESYLVTCDSASGRLKDTALPVAYLEEIIQASRAKAKVMILDACHAGEKLRSKGSESLHPKFIERVYMHAQGMVILAACGQHQKSYIWETKKCSAYTYFLLEALRGKADRDAKGFVSVTDIYDYVTNGIASWAERHRYVQTPTIHIRAHGQIIVSSYKMQPEPALHSERPSEAIQQLRPKQASFTPTLPPSWAESETTAIQGQTYILYKATVQERLTRDRYAVLRTAQAQHASKGNMVQLKQVCIFQLTPQGNALRVILQEEHRLALKLAQYREFPRVLEEEGITGESNILTMTLVYEAWTGPTLGAAFHRSGRALTETEVTPLLQSFIRVCKVVSKLHKAGRSHRALTADSIILLGGDKYRPVLQDFGLAAHPTKSGGIELVQIQAPEQRYSTLELALPGPQTDIYQLGVILSTLITGQPFSAAMLDAYGTTSLPGIDNAIKRAVATLPKERWSATMAFANELTKILKER